MIDSSGDQLINSELRLKNDINNVHWEPSDIAITLMQRLEDCLINWTILHSEINNNP